MDLGPAELLVILVVVLLLFGPGRIAKVAGEAGKAIREFRTGLKEEPEKKPPGDASDGTPGSSP